MDKFKRYTANQCAYALADCHEALRVTEGEAYHRKLWAEIDAIRARQLQLSKRCQNKIF